LYKALAALWVVSRKLDLGHQFSAAISVFLPPGEFNDSKQFFELLSQYSASFETPTGKLSVTLDKTQALQEGGGIALIHNSNLGSAFKQRVTAFVMVGFRNASVIVSARGAVGKGKTSDLGMVRLVDLVQDRTSNYDASRLALSIASSGVSYNRPYFYRIARNREEAARDREVDQLIEAVKLSRFDYARMLSHWINEVLPPDLDEIVFCGGTSEYMKPELRNQFSHYSLSWHAGITVPKTLDPDGLGCRIADVYGLFSYFKSQFEAVLRKPVATTSQKGEGAASTSQNAPVSPTGIQKAEEGTEQKAEEKAEEGAEQKAEEGTEQKGDSRIKDSYLDASNELSDESNLEPSLDETEASLDAALLLGGPYRGSGKKVKNYA
ncbi:MAG: hypothetical protein ACMG55_11135, partial [Microcoleus sp.]